MERFKKNNDGELVEAFNKEIDINASFAARAVYLFAIRDEPEGR